MINSNLKQSGDRYYPITWIHRTIDPSTERCLSPSVWSKWSMRGFQGIWALNASWPELQWRGPLLPVFRWKLWTFENQIHESYQSHGNTKPFNLLMCSLKLENTWEKIELEKSFSHSIFQGFQDLKENMSLWIFESTNDPQTTHRLIKQKLPTSTRTLLSSALMSALSLSTFSFLGPGDFTQARWQRLNSNHPPTSMVDQQCPTQRTCTKNNLRPTSSNKKIGWKNSWNIVSCVNPLLRLVSKVAEACHLQAVKQLHRTGIARIPKK